MQEPVSEDTLPSRQDLLKHLSDAAWRLRQHPQPERADIDVLRRIQEVLNKLPCA